MGCRESEINRQQCRTIANSEGAANHGAQFCKQNKTTRANERKQEQERKHG